jgi:5-methylcytosine-specific restriction endonuclease McrA
MSLPSKLLLWLAQSGLCFHCHEPMAIGPARKTSGGYDNGWTREHLVPKSKGGKHGHNVVLAHVKCNSARGNADPTPEMLRRGRAIHKNARRLARRGSM